MDGINKPGEKLQFKIAYVLESIMYGTEGKRLRSIIVGK